MNKNFLTIWMKKSKKYLNPVSNFNIYLFFQTFQVKNISGKIFSGQIF
jgi:hypothetical protein